jgi:hypothetical protein
MAITNKRKKYKMSEYMTPTEIKRWKISMATSIISFIAAVTALIVQLSR